MTAQRQPVFNVPGSILIILATLVAIHLLRLSLNDQANSQILAHFAFLPARLVWMFDAAAIRQAVAVLASSGKDGPANAQAAQFLIGSGSIQPWTLLTYAGIHANWTHLGSNSIWLLAFGTPVARRFGALRFYIFFAATAVAGALMHFAVHPFGLEPIIGASAAVSGTMGASMRFAFQPGGPLGATRTGLRQPALTLREVFTNQRTMSFLGVWFIVNFVFGIASQSLGMTEGPIAWEAHVGGLLAGLMLFPLFDRGAPQHGEKLASWPEEAHP